MPTSIYETNLIFGIMWYVCVFYYLEEQRCQACISHKTGQNYIQLCHEIPLIWNVRLVWFYLLFTCYSNRSAVARQRNVIWIVERCYLHADLQAIFQHIYSHTVTDSESTVYELTELTTDILVLQQSSEIWYISAVKESLPFFFTKNENVLCCRNNLMPPMSEWLINVTEKINSQVHVNSWY